MLAWPASALAGAPVSLVSPRNGYVTTNQWPTFVFAVNANDSYEWNELEIASDPALASNGDFLSGNHVRWGWIDEPERSYTLTGDLDFGQYYWHVRHYNWDEGAYTTSPAWKIKIVSKTKQAFRIRPKKVKKGRSIKISGRLKDQNNEGIANKTIIIKAGKKRIKKVKTDYFGEYVFKIKPKKTAKYQAVFKKKGVYRSSKSKKIRVAVKKR